MMETDRDLWVEVIAGADYPTLAETLLNDLIGYTTFYAADQENLVALFEALDQARRDRHAARTRAGLDAARKRGVKLGGWRKRRKKSPNRPA